MGHPYSALNLRLVLAAMGFVGFAVLAGLALWLGYPWLAVPAVLLALVGVVDMVVVQRRRRERRRVDQEHHSLFE